MQSKQRSGVTKYASVQGLHINCLKAEDSIEVSLRWPVSIVRLDWMEVVLKGKVLVHTMFAWRILYVSICCMDCY